MCVLREIRLLFAVTPGDSASAHSDTHCRGGSTAPNQHDEDQKVPMFKGEQLQGLEPRCA